MNEKNLTKEEELELFKNYQKAKVDLIKKILYFTSKWEDNKILKFDDIHSFIYKRLSLINNIPKIQKEVEIIKNTIDTFTYRNLKLIYSISKKYSIKGDISNFVQDASFALLRSISKFNANKGFKFSTYATMAIRQSVVKSLNDTHRSIRVPLHKVQKLWKTGTEIPFTKNISMLRSMANSKQNYGDIIKVKTNNDFFSYTLIDILDNISVKLSSFEEYVFRFYIYNSKNETILRKFRNKFVLSKVKFETILAKVTEEIKLFIKNKRSSYNI